jgi:hypothetical protein
LCTHFRGILNIDAVRAGTSDVLLWFYLSGITEGVKMTISKVICLSFIQIWTFIYKFVADGLIRWNPKSISDKGLYGVLREEIPIGVI